MGKTRTYADWNADKPVRNGRIQMVERDESVAAAGIEPLTYTEAELSDMRAKWEQSRKLGNE